LVDVSIITPFHNSCGLLKNTIVSVLDQTLTNWEWLIIEDTSKSKISQRLTELKLTDSRIKAWTRKSKNTGASVCRNVGIKKARGDYIVFLDSDDFFELTCLSDRVSYMRESPNLDFAVFKMMCVLIPSLKQLGLVNSYYSEIDEYLDKFKQYKAPWQTSCPIWKTAFLIKNNLFYEEEFQRLQDIEFHCNVLCNTNPRYDVVQNHSPDSYYVRHSLDQTPLLGNQFDNRINGFILLAKRLYDNLDPLDHHSTKNFNQFVLNSFKTMLFYYRLDKHQHPIKFWRELKQLKNNMPISTPMLLFFFYANLAGITFIKGFGISRIWNFLLSEKEE